MLNKSFFRNPALCAGLRQWVGEGASAVHSPFLYLHDPSALAETHSLPTHDNRPLIHEGKETGRTN